MSDRAVSYCSTGEGLCYVMQDEVEGLSRDELARGGRVALRDLCAQGRALADEDGCTAANVCGIEYLDQYEPNTIRATRVAIRTAAGTIEPVPETAGAHHA